jgi:hypothetical protein
MKEILDTIPDPSSRTEDLPRCRSPRPTGQSPCFFHPYYSKRE